MRTTVPAPSSATSAPTRTVIAPAPAAPERTEERKVEEEPKPASVALTFDFGSFPIDPPPPPPGDAPPKPNTHSPFVQKKCACAGGKKCDKCRNEEVARRSADASEPADALEAEADALAAGALRELREPKPARLAKKSRRTAIGVQREESGAGESGAEDRPAGYVVEDEATPLSGQMRKSELLDELKTESCRVADEELARVGRDTRGCPYVERWLEHYRERSAAHVEGVIRRFAPGARDAHEAREYVPLVAARMRAGVAEWAETGELPNDLPAELRQAIAEGAAVDGVMAVLRGIGGILSGGIGAIAGLFFKQREGGAAKSGADRGSIARRLGTGRPLESALRARMESGFGHDFSNVRVHVDRDAAELSEELGAHAFALGEHVAFASGKFSPSTGAGETLLAHELAHVIQQGRAPAAAPRESGEASRAQEALGPGAELDPNVRMRMETAFRRDFSGVRVHADDTGAELADRYDAHAFTVGTDVAFERGAYRPGTIAGDLLIAHELAHTVQQDGASGGSASEEELERSADAAAMRALHFGSSTAELPHTRGLALQRCDRNSPAPAFSDAATLIRNIQACDGGLGLWAAARTANGNRDPDVRAEVPTSGFRAETETSTGIIRINPTIDTCTAMQSLVHELSNLSRKADFDRIDTEATAGNVSRDDYIRRNERLEYEGGVLNRLTAFDACHEQWGCPGGSTSTAEWARGAASFDDYFALIREDHKEYFGGFWDRNYRDAYRRRHP